MKSRTTAVALLSLLAGYGCDRFGLVNRTPSVGGPGGAGGHTTIAATSQTGSGGSAGMGLPCEVQAVLIKYCDSCHGAPPSGGAPRALVTYADLTRSDMMNSSISEAQAAMQRIQDKTSPMPPSPAAGPSSSEMATLQGWIDSGYPSGTCGASSAGGAGGTTATGSGGATGGSAGNGGGGSGLGGAGGSNQGGAGGACTQTLPSDIQTLLTDRCVSCHGATPSGGAPRSLATYADLTATDFANSSLTEAQVALQRMQNTTAPMPPAPAARATSAEITAMQNWINSGYPSPTCGGGGAGGGTQPGAGGGGQGGGGAGGTTTTSTGGSSGIADAGVPGGTLPCDVQTLLASRCESCHGQTPSGGAPSSLVTYANLTAADVTNPSLTEAQAAVQRMQSTTAPMPPSPASPATSAEIAVLQNWISGGYASGSCSGDAGAPKPDPLNASPTCTSKTNWTGGTNGSGNMEPGQACITCHATTGGEAPTFVIAGTLYPTGHEPDNCNGVNGSTSGAKVVVTGNGGTSVTLTPNSVGNFYSTTRMSPPYQAKVVSATGAERVMATSVTTGDCNSCHTQNGASSAPGRITLPP
jgi:uncharacterized membrane protein